MPRRLRLGVLGLGGRWPRFRAALPALRDQLRLRTVWDDVAARAEREADLVGCAVAGGAGELLESDAIDAVLLAGQGWHGLWALERALASGKPVLCALSPLAEEGKFDELLARHPEAPVQLTLWPALEVLAESAAARVAESLGVPALLQASWVRPGEPIEALHAPEALALLAISMSLFDAAPIAVTALRPVAGMTLVVVELDQGVAQLSLATGPAGVAGCRLRLECEDGALTAEIPRRFGWASSEGRHERVLPAVPAEALVLDRFVQAVEQGALSGEDLRRAGQALGWLRAARRSAAEGRRIELTASS